MQKTVEFAVTVSKAQEQRFELVAIYMHPPSPVFSAEWSAVCERYRQRIENNRFITSNTVYREVLLSFKHLK